VRSWHEPPEIVRLSSTPPWARAIIPPNSATRARLAVVQCCSCLSLLILGGGYIVISFLVGELFDFGPPDGRIIDGVRGSTAESPSTLGGALWCLPGDPINDWWSRAG